MRARNSKKERKRNKKTKYKSIARKERTKGRNSEQRKEG